MNERQIYAIVAIIWIVIASLGFIFWKNFFPPLDENFNKYIYAQDVPESDNAYLDFAGFVAPKGFDPHEFGKTMLEQSETYFTDPDDYSWLGKPDPKITIENPKGLWFQKPKETNFYCHIFQTQYHQTPDDQICPDEPHVKTLLNDNDVLLKRYENMFSRRRFYEEPRLIRSYDEEWLFWTVEQTDLLYSLHIIEMAKAGQPEEALKLWINKHGFLNRILSDEQSQDIKFMFSDLSRWSIETLPVLLKYVPVEIIRQYNPQLQQTLDRSFFGENGLNVDAMLRADYFYLIDNYGTTRSGIWWLNIWLRFNNNLMKNAYLEMIQDLSNLSAHDNPVSYHLYRDEILEKWKVPDNKWEKVKVILTDYGRSVMSDYYVDQKLFENFSYRMRDVANMRLMKLYVQAKADNIAREDMPAYVTANAEAFKDPFTGDAYQWNAATHQIYYLQDNIRNIEKGFEY